MKGWKGGGGSGELCNKLIKRTTPIIINNDFAVGR